MSARIILALVLLLPVISAMNTIRQAELSPGVILVSPLIPRPYMLSIMVRGGRLVVNGESLSGFVHIHFGDAVCSHTVERVLARAASCNLRDGARFWMKIYRDLGIEGKSASEILETLRSRGTGSIALPTITIRFTLYDEDGDEYTAVFTISPMDYYRALRLRHDKAMMRALERPLEFIERGLMVIIERDHLISQLARVPRISDLLRIPRHMRLELHSLYEAGEEPGVLETTFNTTAGEPTYQLALPGSHDCRFAGLIPIYNWTTPDQWLASKIHVEIRNNTISRDRVYQLLWESYLNLFGRYIVCPGSWSQSRVLDQLHAMYGAIFRTSPLNSILDPTNLLTGLVKTNAYLDYYVRVQRRVDVKWNYTCPRTLGFSCVPGQRNFWYFTAYKPYMIFLHQDGYPANDVCLHMTFQISKTYGRTGIAIGGYMIWGGEHGIFGASYAMISLNSLMFEQFNISAVALLVPATYYFVGDAFYVKVDLWRQGGYWYATVTPIPFPDYREVEERSHEHWRIVDYNRTWAPISCTMWNGTPVNDCPRLDALSVLNSVAAFTNYTYYTVYSTNYLNVSTVPLVIDTSQDISLSYGESLASVAFGVFRDIGLMFAPNISPSMYATPVLFLVFQVSYVDATFRGSGVVYDLYLRRLTTSYLNPPVVVQKMTFGYSHTLPRTPLLAAYFVYVGN